MAFKLYTFIFDTNIICLNWQNMYYLLLYNYFKNTDPSRLALYLRLLL